MTRKRPISPTRLSLQRLRAMGALCEVCERWVPRVGPNGAMLAGGHRKDLFGIVDIIAVLGGETLFIQTTSETNVGARRRKMLAAPETAALLRAGNRVEIWGWRKIGGRWRCRARRLVLEGANVVALAPVEERQGQLRWRPRSSE